MIKANNKDALAAFYRGDRIAAAYFRGNKIWEHIHSWSNGTCAICGKVCSHSWSNTTSGGTCSICGLTHTHTWDSDGYCTVCGYDGAAFIAFKNSSYFNFGAAENSISFDGVAKAVTSVGPYRIPPGRRAVTAKMYVAPPSNAIAVLTIDPLNPPGIVTGPGTAWGVAGYVSNTETDGEDGKYTYNQGQTYTYEPYFYYNS